MIAASAAAASLPRPSRFVEDRANVIDAQTEQRLLGRLQELEQKTTAQFIVLTVDTTGGVPIEQYALGLAESWKLGQKGKDNGLLLVVAVKDRKYDFETGYGMEEPLPDSFLGTVGRNQLVPHFKRGDYSRGIEEAVTTVLGKLSAYYKIELKGVPQWTASQHRPVGRSGMQAAPCTVGGCVLFVIFFILMSVIAGRVPWWWWLLGAMTHHNRSWPYGGGWQSRGWHGSSGGSFGGGFGGFGGGGGGSFGGGGARGDW